MSRAADALTRPGEAIEIIRDAHVQIRGHVHRTPLLRSRAASELAGVAIYLKCESLQRGGSFKIRGALTKVLSLDDAQRERGLVAHSSGNHAQGLALAAQIAGAEATVFMPEDAPEVKVAATRGYGAEVRFAGTTNAERVAAAYELMRERELTMVPPYDDPSTICGAGTVGLEIAEQSAAELAAEPAAVFVPIGGGGLISGVALAMRALSPRTRVVGVEPEGAARARAALDAGERVTLDEVSTVADGLRPAAVGEHNWEVIRRFVDDVVTVSDNAILRATRLMFDRARLVVEPSGAASVAGAIAHGRRFASDGPAVAVISGGNIGEDAMARVLALPAT